MINYETQYYCDKVNGHGDVKTIEHYTDFNTREPDYWEMHYRDRWIEAARLLPSEVLLAGPRLLDIGCGLGRSLEHFNRYGLKAEGIEPNHEAVRIAHEKGLPVMQGYVDSLLPNDERYDIIHIEQVLSHSSDYKHILRSASHLLSDSGVLVIEEPNDCNPLQVKLRPRLGEYWRTLDHVNYFNFDSMKEALEAEGFEVRHQTATYPMELFELSGRHYVGNDEAGHALHQEVTKMLSAVGSGVRKGLLDGFASQGLGRDLVVFAQKKGVL